MRPGRRARRSAVVTLLAAVAAFLVVDLVAGVVLGATDVLPPVDRGDLVAIEREGLRRDFSSPAIADEPWAQEFADELLRFQTEAVTYEPFVIQGTHEFHGEHLNTTDVERRTHQPELDARQPMRIAFFGGSAVFGIGQRDEHTVPSAFARAADAAGVPVEVHNYGFPRQVAWQELQQVERILEREGPFDLALFYDGFNELFVQAEHTSTDPTHHAVGSMQDLVGDYFDDHETEPGATDALGDLWSAYRRNSAVVRLFERITGAEPPPAGTQEVSTASVEEQTEAALAVYRRATRWIADVTAEHGTPVRFFWQPRREGWPASITDRLPPEVVDLSDLFVGREDSVYIDLIHTNEDGAREVAEAIWAEVAGDLEGSS